jgi:transmembrane sensor
VTASDERREKFFRAWAATERPFDRDVARDRFLTAWRPGRGAKSRNRLVAGLAFAAALACTAIALWLHQSATLTFTTPSGPGQVGAWLATDASSELPLSFSEKTRIVLHQDSRGRVEHLGQSGTRFLLERGVVAAQVTHRTGADWRFVAGPFEVLVTGTALTVAWDPATERFVLGVDTGSVVVHGPYVGGDQQVRAGEQCVVDLPAKSMRLSSEGIGDSLRAQDGVTADAPARADAPELPAPTGASALLPPSRPRRSAAISPEPTTSWTELDERGDYDGAYAAAQHAGVASLYRSAPADALLRLAQVGQLSGHREMERDALLACRRRFPGTPQAALAAYELGRAASPSEAATWFDAYLAEQPSGSLAREALGRLIEAHSLAGNNAAAREVAKQYLARYPQGPHTPLAHRILARHDGREE